MASILERVVQAALPKLTVGVGVALPALQSLTLQGTALAGDVLSSVSVEGVVQRLPKLSANEVIRQLHNLGYKVRRKTALKTIKTIRQQADAYEYISRLTPGQKPLQNQIPLTATRQRLKYQYTVKLTGYNSLLGENGEQYIRINSPRLLSKNQAIGYATDVLLSERQYEISSIDDAEVTLITKQNPGIENI